MCYSYCLIYLYDPSLLKQKALSAFYGTDEVVTVADTSPKREAR